MIAIIIVAPRISVRIAGIDGKSVRMGGLIFLQLFITYTDGDGAESVQVHCVYGCDIPDPAVADVEIFYRLQVHYGGYILKPVAIYQLHPCQVVAV